MNEGSGTWANDTSGFANNGSITGALWSIDSVNGSALSFDGTGDYVTTAPANSMNLTNDFTIAGWVKTNTLAGNQNIISKTNVNVNGYRLFLTGGLVAMQTYYGGINSINTDKALSNQTWHYIQVVDSGQTGNIYVDGNLMKSGSLSYAQASEFNVTIGDYIPSGGETLNGKLDELEVYNYALNASERTTEYQQFQPVPAYPTGGMSLTGTHINFTWHDTEFPADKLLVSSDPGFLTLFYDSITTSDYANISLPGGTYYWKVQQYNSTTGTYGETSAVNTVSLNVAAAVPGRFNITTKDEQTGATILTFNVTLYNITATLNKVSAAGWTNFSSAEVASGEYLIRITSVNFGSRNVLAISPGNVTIYLPSTTNATVNTIAFYLVDTTGRFPASGSKITITKNGATVFSSYFDADMKAVANLINGDSYAISISYGSNVQNWGNYIPVSSGNVQIFLTQIGINTTETRPFVYNITQSSSAITLAWTDTGGVMSSLNFTIYKGSSMALVHQLITSVIYGQSTYTITAPDIYYVYFTASTTQGTRYQVFAFDTSTTINVTAKGKMQNVRYGSFTLPTWVKDVIGVLFIILLAGGFGAIYAELGGIITIISALFLLQNGFMSGTGAGAGFMGGLAVVIVLAYMKARDSGQVAMMAYKAAMFLIFFNFAILIINTSGIIPGTYVDIYGNDCQGTNAGSPGCILARMSSLAPQESTENAAGIMQQLGLILITATAFGLIILTLNFMLALFYFGVGISEIYLSQLPISWEWKLPLQTGILILYIVGFMQYKAATSLKSME